MAIEKLAQPLTAGNFRIAPLNFSVEETSAFQTSVREIEINAVAKTITLRVFQMEDSASLGVTWRILHEKVALQLDAYTRQGNSAFSIVALDCKAIDHQFTLSSETAADAANHHIIVQYRKVLRLGPNGDMSVGKEDDVSDADRMLTKLLMRPPYYE